MKFNDITEPIAQRVLMAGSDPVLVTIGKPVPTEDMEDYYCPFSIEFLGKKKISYAVGIDSVQALQLALQKIGVELDYLSMKRRVTISWLSDTPGETGFPGGPSGVG